MDALQEYIRGELDARGWRQADLARASGLSPQLVSQIMHTKRRKTRIEESTVAGLVRAFGEQHEPVIRRKVVEAMGMDPSPVQFVRTVQDASDEELLAELARRLNVSVRVTAESGKSATFLVGLGGRGSSGEAAPAAPLRRVARRDDRGPSADG